ncbi:hypothetical protein EYF80_042383 [Liparis tanakae]|uniref:Uncharacterized protein n=1 Tax=Liparis tanakae TaxID=230148 RepID=A0A4Z2G2Q1_9TELE|nr:hypothetical protein EYF80_042383 [Liparis tanakae]
MLPLPCKRRLCNHSCLEHVALSGGSWRPFTSRSAPSGSTTDPPNGDHLRPRDHYGRLPPSRRQHQQVASELHHKHKEKGIKRILQHCRVSFIFLMRIHKCFGTNNMAYGLKADISVESDTHGRLDPDP